MNSIGRAVERHLYIDALRVLAILLMLVFHVSMIFAAESNWHIKNSEQSRVLLEVNYFLAFFRMPLLFLVSGFVAALLLNRLNWQQFIWQRFARLIIPLVIWTFVLVAPQIYFERKLQGYSGSYWEFYKTFLELKWYPQGNFHWLHLWFIPYLFVYNLLSIPLFWCLCRVENKMSEHHYFICIIAYAALASWPYALLTIKFPVTYDLISDWARHAFYLPFVLAGVICCKFTAVVNCLERKRQVLLRWAFLTTLAIFTLRWNDWDPFSVWANWIELPQTYIYLAGLNLNSWLWVLALLGYAKRYLSGDNAFFSYANKAVYPFYILHQTVIVTLGYYVVQTHDNAAFKYVFILFSCFWLCVLIYHVLIRPYPVVRFLFGSK